MTVVRVDREEMVEKGDAEEAMPEVAGSKDVAVALVSEIESGSAASEPETAAARLEPDA